MNLTAIVDYQDAQVKHFLDSLTVAMVIPEDVKANGRLVDIGSGGGFPGMPLKVAFSGMHVTVVDSVSKKAGFMDHLAQTLGLDGFEVCAGRAEDLAQDSRLRESFDVVVSRGVAAMRILMELTLPYCRVGEIVVTMKKGSFSSEVEASLHAMDVLEGGIRETRSVDMDGLRDGRALVVVEKLKPTPTKFPRRPGLPAKHPL